MHKISGIYYNNQFNKYSPDYEFISICSDSVYYSIHNDIMGSGFYKGSWARSLDTLFLHIPQPCNTKFSQLIERTNPNLDKFIFECKLLRSCGDTLSLSYDTLIIDDYVKVPIDSMGFAHVNGLRSC